MANEEDANEAAARRIQEQIWAQEAEEMANEEAEDHRNNAGAVQEFVRQLLDHNDANNDEDDGGEEGLNNDDNNAAGGGAVNLADEDEEEEEEEEEDDDADDDEDNAAENRRGAIDGGIAGEVRDENSIKITRSLKCPLVLYFECADDLDELLSPNNPMLKKGTTVYIGLDKNTKLSLVFNQYCKFVNSKIPKEKGADVNALNTVRLADLEFLHCTLLDANNTVEASAMMKNDHIKVYRERSKERATKMEVLRQQRESDRKYFKDLRQLLPNPSPEGLGCDVVLDCRGKVMDERGFSQNVLATTVRANSVLISKRCKWLGHKILAAREDVRRRAEMTVPSENEEKSDANDDDDDMEEDATADGAKSGQSDDDDDIIMAGEPVARAGDGNNDNNNNVAGGEGSAAKVEDDEDEDDDGPSSSVKVKVAKASSRKSSARKSDSQFPNSVWVSLDHSPQAVKLLLEYCYTNRVQSLGHEAFMKASKYPNPKDVGALAAKMAGPIAPFRKHEWPEGGAPTVSLHLALAGIALAEEAHMPRLSLMCEVAASQLVDKNNVLDVLSACQVQQQKTGNRLPVLRKAAMLDCIMVNGSVGIDQLYANPNFKNNLIERRDNVIPSLLDGTVEVMPANMNTKEIRRKKDRIALERKKMCELNDNTDKNKRIMERIKWRNSSVARQRMELAYGPDRTALRLPSTKIFRDTYRGDPLGGGRDSPSLGGAGSGRGRGTKRKAPTKASSSARSDDGGSGGAATRSVRRKTARKNRPV